MIRRFLTILFLALLVAPSVAAQSVSVSWTASLSTVTGYRVYRGSKSGGPYVPLVTAAAVGYTDTAVLPGTTYYYVVTAVAGVESVYSNEAVAIIPGTPPPSPPPSPIIQHKPLTATNCATVSISLANPVAVGAPIHVSIAAQSTSHVATVSNKADLFVQDMHSPSVNLNNGMVAHYDVTNSIGGSRPVTVTFSPVPNNCFVDVAELAPGYVFDVSASLPFASTSTPSAGIVVTSGAGLLIGTVGVYPGAKTFSAANAFSILDADGTGNARGATEYFVTPSAGPHTDGWKLNVNVAGAAILTAFKQSGPPAPPVSVSVAPASATLLAGQTQQFTATVQNSTNPAVNWSATCGTITASGLFTAPNTGGTCAITVASQADLTKMATAAVTVPQPSLTIACVNQPPSRICTITPTNIPSGTPAVISGSSDGATVSDSGALP